jgi:Glyoxalase-like domain
VARIRQAVLAARDLGAVRARLELQLGLGEPFADPAVSYFGLENAVYAIGDTFLEVVSPVAAETAAGRLLDRRGAECGYMVMFQVDDLDAARARAREAGVREVFSVELDEIREVHLHPADIGGAIVSLSEPSPPESWKWGGPGWERRSVSGAIAGIRVAVAEPVAVRERWDAVVGGLPDAVEFVVDAEQRGLVAIDVERDGRRVEVAPTQLASRP